MRGRKPPQNAAHGSAAKTEPDKGKSEVAGRAPAPPTLYAADIAEHLTTKGGKEEEKKRGQGNAGVVSRRGRKKGENAHNKSERCPPFVAHNGGTGGALQKRRAARAEPGEAAHGRAARNSEETSPAAL